MVEEGKKVLLGRKGMGGASAEGDRRRAKICSARESGSDGTHRGVGGSEEHA